MVINHARLQNAVLNMERLNIVMNATIIHVKNTNTLMNTILLSHTSGKVRFAKSGSVGIEQYNLEQKEKIQILSRLLSNYNDGRRKNFFCVAVNLLELSELKEAMNQIQSNDKLPLLPIKEQCSYVAEILQRIADRRNIKLKLMKKK